MQCRHVHNYEYHLRTMEVGERFENFQGNSVKDLLVNIVSACAQDQNLKVDDLVNKLLKTCERQNLKWPPVAQSESKYFLTFEIKIRSYYATVYLILD